VTDERIGLLVLGLGNTICGDDGVGVAAVEAIGRGWEAPEGVRVLDGGTLGLSLLPWLQMADRVILVDAIAADAPPGSHVRLDGQDVAHAAAHRLSVHQVGVADLLDGARLVGDAPEQIVLLGVVPESMELTTDLSEPVARALPELVERVVRTGAELGFPLRRCA